MNIAGSHTELFIAVLGIIATMLYGYLTGKADLSGTLTGGIIAVILFIAVKWIGLILFLTFFIVGSLASKWKYDKKVKLGVAQGSEGQRTAIHAYSNAGAAALYACLAFFNYQDLAMMMIAGVFAAALSDTLSSEIGNIAGSQYCNILTFRKGDAGKDGVISWEGTLAGLVGSFLIAGIYYLFEPNVKALLIIASAGFAANILDSILGAAFQPKIKLSNHQVNLMATSAGGLFSGALYLMLTT